MGNQFTGFLLPSRRFTSKYQGRSMISLISWLNCEVNNKHLQPLGWRVTTNQDFYLCVFSQEEIFTPSGLGDASSEMLAPAGMDFLPDIIDEAGAVEVGVCRQAGKD